MRRGLPIGVSDFKSLIEGGYAYVDKTLLIEELVEKGGIVSLIPRFRRFGKTLNLSMLRYFFEKGPSDTSALFNDLKIWKKEKFRTLQGQFPVIFLTLKDVKHESWDLAYRSLRLLIAEEFLRHKEILTGNTLDAQEKELYQRILRADDDQALFERSLLYLSNWLYRFHQKKVVLLIDEYDTPAHSAFIGKYYDKLISFLRNWLSGGLKDNPSLERGVLTGILRIAKESIFSGLNNISTYTILNETFMDKFGLLEDEVKELLMEYDLIDRLSDIRQWYNGYQIGSCKGIYNPWSVLKCIEEKGALLPYWVNTSDNALIKRLLTHGADKLKADIEELLKGSFVEKTIEEGVVFSNLEKSSNSIWSLLLFSGYLTLADTPFYGTPSKLCIPNNEVTELYKSLVAEWFERTIQEDNYHLLLNSLITGDVNTFFQIFQEFLSSAVSVFDLSASEPEKIYHAFVLGMLVGLKERYEVKSNRESGYGRYDVMLIPKDSQDLGIIIEFKKVGRFEKSTLESAAASALKQIEERNYISELHQRGVRKNLYLALAFKGKKSAMLSKFV